MAAGDQAGPGPDLSLPSLDPGRDGALTVATFELPVPIEAGMFGSIGTTVLGPGQDAATLLAGPFPLVVLSPERGIDRHQYTQYGRRLASLGLLCVIQSPRDEINHQTYRDDTIKLLTWLINPVGAGAEKVRGRVDPAHVGLAGHGLGGKISLVVTARDSRIKAVLGIDPVDYAGLGGVSALMDIASIHLGVPIVLLGEDVSTMGAMCTPPDQNYAALFTRASSPTWEVPVAGAAHVDFMDNPQSCGCPECGGGTADPATTHALALKYTAAYFLWALSGQAAALPFLQSAEGLKIK